MFTKKTLLIATLSLAIAALAAGLATAADDARSKEFDFPAGGRLELDFPAGGSARVEGWDRPTASVTWTDRRNDLDDYDVAFDAGTAGLKITAEPKDPVPFPMIMGAAMGAPQTIPQVLGVTITANDEM